jgi:hypothetical protein
MYLDFGQAVKIMKVDVSSKGHFSQEPYRIHKSASTSSHLSTAKGISISEY